MNRIRQLREARGLSLAELASLVGTSQPQMSRLERGERRLTVGWMQKIAQALNCSPTELIEVATIADGGDEVAPYTSHDLKIANSALMSKHLGFFVVQADSVEQIGIGRGHVVLVDTSVDALAGIRTGAIVVARISVNDDGHALSKLLLRQWVAPNLLVTNRSHGNVILQFRDDRSHIEIVGVVVAGGKDDNT